MELREYQQNCINLIRDEVRKGKKRILLQLCTGGGKSHIMGAIAASAITKGHKVLALMHRRQLVTQLCERFSECAVDPGIIMSGEESSLGCQCQVATCQTYARRLKLEPIETNRFFIDASVIMIDEAHHALNDTYQKILSLYSDKIVIGVTATPILSSGIGMGQYFDSLVSTVTVQQLIDGGHLVKGIYYGPSTPDLSKLKTVAGDYEKTGLNKLMNNPKLIGDVVTNWLKLAGDKKTMVFAVKVDHSKALRDEFLKHGVTCEHLDAHSNDDDRSDVLQRFHRGETQVLCNVGLYTEGTDIPDLQCLVMARPTKSLGLHLQMVGRGARPYPGKDSFLVLDHGGNIDRLGFYEDEISWSLLGKELGYEKKVVRKKEKKLITCEMCSYIFTGPRCPQCGHMVKHWNKMIEAEEADLVELGKNRKKFTMQEKMQWYGMFMHEQRRLGKSHSWLLAQYKSKFKVWPRGMDDIGPIEPDQGCKNWLTYQRIKWIKSKQKQDREAVNA